MAQKLQNTCENAYKQHRQLSIVYRTFAGDIFGAVYYRYVIFSILILKDSSGLTLHPPNFRFIPIS